MKPLQEFDFLKKYFYNIMLEMEIKTARSCSEKCINLLRKNLGWFEHIIYKIIRFDAHFDQFRKVCSKLTNTLRMKSFFSSALHNYFSKRKLLEQKVRNKLLKEL